MAADTFTVIGVCRDEDNTNPTGMFTFRSVDERFVNQGLIVHSTLIEVDFAAGGLITTTLITNVGGYEVYELVDGADPVGPYIIPGTADIDLSTVDPGTAHFDASGVVNVVPGETVSGTTYTLDLSDGADVVKQFTAATAVAVRVDGSAALPIGWTASWMQQGAGRLTFSAINGAVIHSIGGVLTSQGQWASGTVRKYSSTGFQLAGEIG